MVSDMGVKRLIETIRTAKEWRPADLSRATGISKQMINHWQKHGATSVAIKHLVALKRVSGLSWAKIGKMLEEIDAKSE